jgi:hypothetical protein
MEVVFVFLSICVLVALLWVACEHWIRVIPEGELPALSAAFVGWAAKGLLIPVLGWILLNSGISDRLPPLLPQIGGTGFRKFLGLLNTLPGVFFMVACWWAAVSVVWLLAIALPRVVREDRREFVIMTVGWSLLALPLSWVLVLMGGGAGVAIALVVWLAPITHVLVMSLQAPIARPSYSAAVAKIKFGKYAEAESEVIRQLEACENDFDGWMMLAELYMNHFDDLPAAQQTIVELCEQPNLNGSQVSVALHRLSDWHLKKEDPDTARLVLSEICRRFPGTHLDRMARLRINQIPASREEMRKSHKPIPLRRYDDIAADVETIENSETNLAEATAEVDKYVEKLKLDPNDVSAREALARTYAERLGRAELGIEQLQLLLGMPSQPAEKRAEWLGLISAWQWRHCANWQSAKTALGAPPQSE